MMEVGRFLDHVYMSREDVVKMLEQQIEGIAEALGRDTQFLRPVFL